MKSLALSAAALLLSIAAWAGPNALPSPDLSTFAFTNAGTPVTPNLTTIGFGPTGRTYVVGAFTTVNGQPRNGVFRLESDGTLGAWSPTIPARQPAFALPAFAAEDAQGNVALTFYTQDQGPMGHLVYVPAATQAGQLVDSRSTTIDFFTGYAFRALAFDASGNLYAAFSTFLSVAPSASIFKFSGGVTRDPAFSFERVSSVEGIGNAAIDALMVIGPDLYVSGRGPALVRASTSTGALDPSWRPLSTSPTSRASAVVVDAAHGWVYAGGTFTEGPVTNLGRFSIVDGSVDSTWTPPVGEISPFGPRIPAMALDAASGHLYVTDLKLHAYSTIGAGAPVATWDPRGAQTLSMALLPDRLLVGGSGDIQVGSGSRKAVAGIPLASAPVTWGVLVPQATELDFGTAAANAAVTRAVTLANVGGSAVSLLAFSLPINAGGIASPRYPTYQATHDCPPSIAPGMSCTATITATMGGLDFQPLDTGSLSLVTSEGTSVATVTLRAGKGGNAFTLSGPAAGDIAAGTTGTRGFTFTNASGASLAFLGAAATSANTQVTHDCPATLAARATCTITLAITPATTGSFTGQLYVGAGASGASPLMFQYRAIVDPDDYDGDGIPNALDSLPFTKNNDLFAANAAGYTAFAQQQYRDFLAREGDAAGVAFWSNQVATGALSRGQVIQAFLGSPEFEGHVAPVARLYFAYFLRIPDHPGLDFWIGYFKSGNPLAAISQAFATSPEFTGRYGSLDNGQFVDLVYQNVLGRPADASGRAFWTGRLEAGAMNRGDVMLAFSESDEYRLAIASEVFVTMAYNGMLRRAPDAAGFSYWVQYRDAGNPELALIDLFLGSAEYRARFLP